MTKYWISDDLQYIYPRKPERQDVFEAIRASLQTPASDGVLDTWTLPYKSSDSDERIRKVIKTLALPENSTVVWGALKQLENEIRFALVADYNALKQSTAKDGVGLT